MSTTTRIEVHRRDGRLICTFAGSHFSPRRLDEIDGRLRVALVATVALLLAGDDVRIEVVVGNDVDLEVVEVAGTVAYDMRGGAATWAVEAEVGVGARLVWQGLPFVVAAGADVTRTTTASLANDAILALRETFVFGRTGESGGDLRTSTVVHRGGVPVLVEDLDLSGEHRAEPAILNGARCLDAVTLLGARLPQDAAILQLDADGSIDRRLLGAAHHSDLDTTWQIATVASRSGNTAKLASEATGEQVVPGA